MVVLAGLDERAIHVFVKKKYTRKHGKKKECVSMA